MGLPDVLSDLVEQLVADGWTVTQTLPWRAVSGQRATAVLQQGIFTLVASTRPSAKPGRLPAWPARNLLYYAAAGPDEPWRKLPNSASFLDFARSQNLELLRSGIPVGSPLKRGIPLPVCSCGKVSFPSEPAAAAVVARPQRRESRSYPCPGNPDVWHLTSLDSFKPLADRSPSTPTPPIPRIPRPL